jgi:hypothetical protein
MKFEEAYSFGNPNDKNDEIKLARGSVRKRFLGQTVDTDELLDNSKKYCDDLGSDDMTEIWEKIQIWNKLKISRAIFWDEMTIKAYTPNTMRNIK